MLALRAVGIANVQTQAFVSEASLQIFRQGNRNKAKFGSPFFWLLLLALLARWAVAYGNIQTQVFVFGEAKKSNKIISECGSCFPEKLFNP